MSTPLLSCLRSFVQMPIFSVSASFAVPPQSAFHALEGQTRDPALSLSLSLSVSVSFCLSLAVLSIPPLHLSLARS